MARVNRLTSVAKERRIRGPILLPLSIAIIILVLAGLCGVYWIVEAENQAQFARTVDAASDFFNFETTEDADVLEIALEGIVGNKEFATPLQAGDHEALLRLAKPSFEELSREHRITHLYFSDIKGVSLLRMHNPDHFGDQRLDFVSRQTMQTGKSTDGLELAKSGALSLRAATPFRVGGEIVGYVEMAEEIGHITDRIHDALNVDLLVLIDKGQLSPMAWEHGRAAYGWTNTWDRFLDVALTRNTMVNTPPELLRRIAEAPSNGEIAIGHISVDGRMLYVSSIPVKNDEGQRVGSIVVVADLTSAIVRSRSFMAGFAVLSLGIGVGLVWFFHRLLGRVERRIGAAIDRQARANADLERVAHVATNHLQQPARDVMRLGILLEDHCHVLLGPDDQENLDQIVAGARQIRDTVDALEDYMDLGINAQTEAVPLDAVLAAAMLQLQPAIGDAVVSTSALPTVSGSPVLLARAFFCLLDQAHRHRHPDRPLCIEVSAMRCEGGWCLTFVDNAMAADLRGEERGEGGGTLTVVERIAQLHGGSLDCTPIAEGGARIRLTLAEERGGRATPPVAN